MSAKEMFEKLGYEQIHLTDEDLYARYDKKLCCNDIQSILFYPHKEIRVLMEDTIKRKVYPPLFTLEELQAINKQVSELGWNNDNN